MNSDSDSRLSHTAFTNDHRFSSSSPAPSMPSGGGGGLMGSSSGSSSSSAAEEEEDTDGEESAPVEEEEEEAVEEQLVSIISAQFIEPESGRIDQDISVEATFEYLTDRTPPLTVSLKATYNDVEEIGPVVAADINEGTASAVINLAQHMEFYHDEAKTEESKVQYSFMVRCEDDGSELQGDVIELPTTYLNMEIIEFKDTLFNPNSAMPILDTEGTLIKALSRCFEYAAEWPDKVATIAGHTNITGDGDSHLELAEKRSQSIKALLVNDSSIWEELSADFTTLDLQMTLKAFAQSIGWPTDPGEVDGASGPATETGVLEFQETYNEAFGGNLGVDGIIGPNTWNAFLDSIRKMAIDASGVDPATVLVTLSEENGGLFPCGESVNKDDIPIDGFQSSENKRVEVLFNDAPVSPEFPSPSTEVTHKDIPAYNESSCTLSLLDIAPEDLQYFKFSDA